MVVSSSIDHLIIHWLRHFQPEFCVDLSVVEDATAHGRAEGNTANATIRRADDRLEVLGDIACVRQTGEISERILRLQRLKERTGVVLEDVGHLASRKPRLDDVVPLSTPCAVLNVETDVRSLLAVGLGQNIQKTNCFRIGICQDGERYVGMGGTRQKTGKRCGQDCSCSHSHGRFLLY